MKENNEDKNNIIKSHYEIGIVKRFDFESKLQRMSTVAKHISDNVLTLPMYADLSTEIVDKICDIIFHILSFTSSHKKLLVIDARMLWNNLNTLVSKGKS